jgi:chromosomal replication initiation ATPase DnaA
MPEPPRQFVLDLPLAPSTARDDFVVTASNRTALAMLDGWPDWPAPVVALVGPPGSGKSHLAEIWRARANARRIGPAGEGADAPVLLAEDLDRAPFDERALFHHWNRVAGTGGSMLIVAREPPGRWRVALADLASRLKAAPEVELHAPDDLLLTAVMAKLFADRQLAVDPGVVAHLASRMERSLDAARDIVRRLDLLSLAEGRRITRPLAARVLQELGGGAEDG